MSEPERNGPAGLGQPLPDDLGAPVRSPSAPAPGEPIPIHYAGCVACGSDHPDGLHLTAVAGEGVSLLARVAITGAHQGAPGLAHGGLIATVLDEAQGFLMPLLGVAAVTGKLAVTYRRPVPIDATYSIRTVCLGVAGRKIHTAATLHAGDTGSDAALAESTCVFVAVGAAHFAPYLGRVSGTRPGAGDVAANVGRLVNP